jgi:hypothetical protein
MCPHTTIYVYSYYFICVLILLYKQVQALMDQHDTAASGKIELSQFEIMVRLLVFELYAYIYIYIHIHIHISMYLYVCMYMYIYIYILCVCVCVYIYMSINICI